MCEPTTLLQMQTAGGVAQTVGSYFAASGQKAALKAQASIADTNARLAELTAQSAIQSGQLEEQRSRLNTAKIKGSQRAALAANGVDLGSDSSVNILTTTDVMGEVDANTINANAARSAWGYRTQAVNFQNEAMMSRATAKGISPWMSAGTTLLTSAAQVGTTRYLMNKEGMIPKDSFWYQKVGK